MFLLFRAQLKSGSTLQLIIMSAMILDNLLNIGLRKEKSSGLKIIWRIAAWISCWIQNFKTPISVVWEIQSSNFCTEMGDRMVKQLHWAYTARGAHKVRKFILPSLQGIHFPVSWSWVWQISLLYCATCSILWLERGKQENHGVDPSSILIHMVQYGPAGPEPTSNQCSHQWLFQAVLPKAEIKVYKQKWKSRRM